MSVIAIEFPKPARFLPVDWERFRGNNHERLQCDWRKLGLVSFARHLGKPLSEELWDDIVHRLGVSRLRVYSHNQEQWTDGVGSCAIIMLDENRNVSDIQYAR